MNPAGTTGGKTTCLSIVSSQCVENGKFIDPYTNKCVDCFTTHGSKFFYDPKTFKCVESCKNDIPNIHEENEYIFTPEDTDKGSSCLKSCPNFYEDTTLNCQADCTGTSKYIDPQKG